jgi:NADPH-dependent curcumin reductase CurA
MEESLKESASEGVDCFFDNVGGPDSSVVLNHMNPRGRVAVCGAIASYNDEQAPSAPAVQWSLVGKARHFVIMCAKCEICSNK